MRLTFILLVIFIATTSALVPDIDNESSTVRLISIGEAFVQAGNESKATELYNNALESAQTANDKYKATEKLVGLCANKRQFGDALEYYHRLLADTVVTADAEVLMYIYGGIGTIYYRMHDYVKAIKNLNHAQELMNQTGRNDYLPTLYHSMGRTLTVAGDVNKATAVLDSAEAACNSDNDMVTLSDIYVAQARLLATKGLYAEAYEYMRKHSVLSRTIYMNRITHAINSSPGVGMARSAVVDKYEKEIENLQATVEAQRKQSVQAGQMAYHAGAALLIVVPLLVMFIVMWYRQRQQIKREQYQADIKQKFLSLITYSTRAPIEKLIESLALELEQAEVNDNRQMLEYGKSMCAPLQSLRMLMGNIAAWNETDTEEGKPDKREVRVRDIIMPIINDYQIIAEDKDIYMGVLIDEKITIDIDPRHFDIIMRNFISNGINFAPEHGKVSVSAAADAVGVSIIVDDDGMGIPQEEIDPITNGDIIEVARNYSNRKNEIGLGLIVSRALVEINGGIFCLRSNKESGTTITLTFGGHANHPDVENTVANVTEE